MLNNPRSYEEACRTFRWRIPELYNLSFDVCDRQTLGGADGHRTALIVEQQDGTVERYTFHVLRLLANRLANVLTARGIRAGDRVALALPPGLAAAIALLAIPRMGALAVPVPLGLGAEPLVWRLGNSGAAALIADPAMLPALDVVRPLLPDLQTILVAAESSGPDAPALWPELETASDSFAPLVTSPDTPAFVFYPTDGAGRPAGIVQAHRAMAGGLPAVEMAMGLFPQFGDIAWTPADWMNAEALFRLVLPAWHHGVAVLATPGPFDPGRGLDMIGRHGVRALWLPPLLVAPLAEAASRPFARPRALASGPDPLSSDLHETVLRAFGIHINEAWGVTETGAVAANLAGMMELRPPSPGRAAPGLTVEAVDEHGRPVRAGERGILAVSADAPGGFLGYWGDAPGPARRIRKWLLTGRLGMRDLDNYLWPEPLAREEGVVLIAGSRVRLNEVEAVLADHPAIAAAGLIDLEGGGLRAFVVPRPGHAPDPAELRAWVRLRRSDAEAPRRIEVVDSLPLAVDGSILYDELRAQPLRIDTPTAEDRWLLRK
ncbi:AMP-binding protein [Magnetospirillum molischianum]|uniref:Acyl-coenzyme A synthetase/AMP-(Fatty) acid ligase n=1 Tax=Magnetospirillum molischianum DSM 120 TaxID=1150626 RepID=H8FUN9_MAGML|nr:AMP-binding protein [Magnetospirillum molischianum]CCG42077.1 Acyl-coenzyme A synthetase/AMP-(Fatty) acid ligase [Magnetospirillum molischianum DSM 120]